MKKSDCLGRRGLLKLLPSRHRVIQEFLTIAMLFVIGVHAQQESGLPFLRNYDPKEYNAGEQNWSIVQDTRGILYIANNNGILEYDGVSWRTIETANRRVVRSLALDSNGVIYAGAMGEFGFLASDSLGLLQFTSLVDKVPSDDRDFADVWKTYATPDGIYFQTSDKIFYWSAGKIRVHKAKTSFHASFLVNNRLYVRQRQVGLMQLAGDSLQLALGGGIFTEDRIYTMLPYDETRILIGSREKGLFLLSLPETPNSQEVSDPISRFRTEADPFLIENQIYHGTTLRNGHFALATVRGGLLIMDNSGMIKQILNKSSGLQDEAVNFIFQDRQDALWLGFNNGGTSRVEISSPVAIFGQSSGLTGGTESIVRHQGTLYAATGTGIFYLAKGRSTETIRFNRVSGVATQCWHLLSIGNSLVAGTGDGVFRIEGNKTTLLQKRGTAYVLSRSKIDTNLIFVGLQEGLGLLRLANGRWRDDGLVTGVTEAVRTIVESKDGELWIGTQFQGLLRVTPTRSTENKNESWVIRRFGQQDGLPNGQVYSYPVAGHEVFATDKGLFRFHAERFVLDSTLGSLFVDSGRTIGRISESREGDVWIRSSLGAVDETFVLRHTASGTYTPNKMPFMRFSDFGVYAIYPEENNVTWFGGPDGLIRYDSKIEKNYSLDFKALVRRVLVRGDSLIYGGAGKNAINPVLAYENNALRFEYAATSYDNESKNRYEYRLDGFDKDWSLWTAETKKDYTNIPEGSYRFHVRAKNIYDHRSLEATYDFKILPPWWKSWWAYILYGLCFVFAVLAVIQVRINNERKRHDLEKARAMAVINAELNEALHRLRETQAQLVQTEKMASLGQMTAGIAHEINNPLAFVNGNLEFFKQNFQHILHLADQVRNATNDDLKRLATDTMMRAMDQWAEEMSGQLVTTLTGTKRIKEIVENLRKFARVGESETGQTDVNADLETIVDLFVKQHPGIRIERQFYRPLYFIGSASQLNQCYLNILTNAIQAIRESEKSELLKVGDGMITIRTESMTVEQKRWICVAISDNGIGIDDLYKSKIFDPFFTTRPIGQGRGLGLAEAYGIVHKHEGTIEVSSQIGKGTTFTIVLPMEPKKKIQA